MSRSATTLDRSDFTIVASCRSLECAWRVVGSEEVAVRRDLLLHSMTHTSDALANEERELHRKWFARRGTLIPVGVL